MTASTDRQDSERPNGRPDDVTMLLHDGAPYPDWSVHNSEKRRFFVPNVGSLVKAYYASEGTKKQLKKQLVECLFEATSEIQKTNPQWQATFLGEYRAGKSWVANYRLKEGRRFASAVALIVGLELAFKSLKSPLNVYDYLRIVPAYYFLDQFDDAKLGKILIAFDNMPANERVARFGEGADLKSFFQVCLATFGQTEDGSVISGLATGSLATQYVCASLAKLINDNFDHSCHVGAVRGAGEDGSNNILGTLDLAPGLKVPAVIPIQDLGPCY